ncbi:protein-cysteine N-palmitoyltransferase Rasp [Anabrus simplex]|uniref:protein-cysteine N-palmitoyltransferase Rasp n=1 Tax=Anabrus simplex TaxID=316456 RepID=UPI0034DD6D25
MYSSLPKTEIYSYFVGWTLGTGYAVYNVYLAGRELYVGVPGWSFLGRRKDAADYEWTTWVTFIRVLLPWIFVQIIVSELIRWKNSSLLSLWYFLFSVIFMSFTLGPAVTILMVFQPCIIYASALMASRSLIWIVSLVSLVIFCNSEIGLNWVTDMDKVRYLVLISMAWNNLRTVSFCLDNLSVNRRGSLLCLLGYCFYLPTLFFGPVILYDKYENGLTRPHTKWSVERLGLVVLNLFRFFGWAVVAELSLHYLYFCTMQRYPEFVWELKPWALYGMGYCMGQFFMVKYTVLYGVSSTFARAEHIDAPHHPKCIARIHLYSKMWRYFDQGLYFFLAKYIYIPCLGKNPNLFRKLMASAVCFVFTYVWHGLYLHVLIWSFLNFMGVSVEGICRIIESWSAYQECENKLLSKENSRRFKALMSVPLFIMAAISNFYFFAGDAVGNIYFKRLFSGSLLANSVLFFFCYCCSQVSIEVSNWEQRTKDKSLKNG